MSIGDFDSTTTRISTRLDLHQLSQLLLQISQRALQLQIHTLLRALPQLHLLIQAPPPPPPEWKQVVEHCIIIVLYGSNSHSFFDAFICFSML